MNSKTIWFGAVGLVFLVLAIGGSVVTSHRMNVAADIHQGSAGRSGDPAPNAAQEQREPRETTGSAVIPR